MKSCKLEILICGQSVGKDGVFDCDLVFKEGIGDGAVEYKECNKRVRINSRDEFDAIEEFIKYAEIAMFDTPYVSQSVQNAPIGCENLVVHIYYNTAHNLSSQNSAYLDRVLSIKAADTILAAVAGSTIREITVCTHKAEYESHRDDAFLEKVGRYQIKDQSDVIFGTGAVREPKEGKGRCDLLPAAALLRLAKHYERGANRYGDRNWEKGLPMSSYLDSGLRHLLRYLDGQRDEDHLAAAAWNILGAMWTEDKFPELIDIPTEFKRGDKDE